MEILTRDKSIGYRTAGKKERKTQGKVERGDGGFKEETRGKTLMVRARLEE